MDARKKRIIVESTPEMEAEAIQNEGLELDEDVNVSTSAPALPKGQKWFEAPDGTLIPGEEGADYVIYRTGGKEVRINPKR